MSDKYEFRELCTKDMFPMLKIMNKIGIREFKECFQNVDVSKAGENVEAVGMSVFFDVAGIVVSNLPNCETEIYDMLASVSNLDKKDIQKMPMSDFVEMIVEFVKKPEFADFFKVVSRLFKSET